MTDKRKDEVAERAADDSNRAVIGKVIVNPTARRCLACSAPVTQNQYGLSICEDCAQRFESIFAEDPVWKQQAIQNEFRQLLREFLDTVDRMTDLIGGSLEEFQQAYKQCKALADKLGNFQIPQSNAKTDPAGL